ncbi:porin [Vibrio astriarenae]
MEKMFKVSAVSAALMGVLAAAPTFAATDSAAGDQYVDALSEFLDGATLSLVGITDTRYRVGKNRTNSDDEYTEELNYTDYNIALNFSSGYHNDFIGLDLGGYFSGSLYNAGGCSEISMCDGWSQDEDQNGALKVTKAAVKFKGESYRADFGLTQMGVGTIGNVWSFVPGTYKGGKAFVELGGFTLGYGGATAHTAPWWMTSSKDPYLGDPNDSTFNYLQSLGLAGKVGDVGLNLGIGHANLAHEDDDNISYKAQVDFNLGQAALSYDLYGVDSEVDYEGFGAHHGLSLKMPVGSWNWMSQLRYTHTENGAEFTPRTVRAYGSNNGTWSQWWDALSDWNQDTELAWYNRLSTEFGNGWFGYVGLGLSTIDEGVTTYEGEYAVNGTIGYTLPSGAMKGTTMRFHTTYLTRDETSGNDQEWVDFRFQVIVPHNFF